MRQPPDRTDTPDPRDTPAYRMGRRIAGRRVFLGLTGDEVAARVGISRVTLSRIERGHVANPSAATLVGLAGVLNTTERWLLLGDEEGLEAPEGDPAAETRRAA